MQWLPDARRRHAREDNIGNLIGRYEVEQPGAKTLLLVLDRPAVLRSPLAGLVALACVERLHDRGQRLPFAVEVLVFADEEGLRYHTAYLGSQVVAGRFDRAQLAQPTPGHSRLGGDPPMAVHPGWPKMRVVATTCRLLQVHIEQGPVPEARRLPVGEVPAIAGQSRYAITFRAKPAMPAQFR